MSLPRIDFPPLGKDVPQIGFGCARLVGGASLRASARLVEAALDLGIRYFDVAPSYGMGTAEDVLGEVLGGSEEGIVATKVGIARPAFSARRARLRRWGKPLLDRSRAIKTLARRLYAPRPGDAPAPESRDFSEAAIRGSLEESLRRLKRGRVDLFLAHEPSEGDLSEEVAGRFRKLVEEGVVGAFGAGVDVREDRWRPFGSVWQSGWPGERVGAYVGDVTHVFHGVIRYAEKGRAGGTRVPASRLLQEAVRAAPESLLLVSTSTPSRLRDLVSEL